MSVSSDASQVENRGKVVKFPVTPLTARKSWSRPKKYGLTLAAIAIVAIGGIAALSWGLGTSSTVQYVTVPVARGPVTRAVTATGTVNPELTIIVGSYVSGVIQSLSCVRGVTIIVVTHMAALIWARSTQAWAMRFS